MHGLLWMLCQLNEDVVGFTIGNDDLDTLVGYFSGDVCLGDHAAAAKATFLIDDVLTKVAVVVHHRDDTRAGLLGITVVDAVDIAEDDKRVTVHHRGDEP